MNLGFIFREGVTGLRRNLSMTIALILTTSISLALLGTGLLVGKMAADTKQLYLDKVEAMVQLNPELSASDKDCSSSQCSDIKKQLESNNKVDSVTYMNQQDSYNRFVQLFQDSDPQLIKRAYRRLLSKHHPDKQAGAGASPAQVREATERTRELHSAYALIRERRGFR